jgi:hypothetical protein
MSLLVFVVIVLVLLGLAIYGVQQLTVPEPPIKNLIVLVFIAMAIVAIALRAGIA